jgi:hypothetical protein
MTGRLVELLQRELNPAKQIVRLGISGLGLHRFPQQTHRFIGLACLKIGIRRGQGCGG